MHGLLAGSRNHPYLTELDATFRSDGLDRLAFLSDSALVEPHHRALNAAICNTSLQAERAEQECVVLEQNTPTVFVIVSCVTINRLSDDTELVCGVSVVDRRGDTPHIIRRGPGTDPRDHVIEVTRGNVRLQVQDRRDSLGVASRKFAIPLDSLKEALYGVPLFVHSSHQVLLESCSSRKPCP